MQKLELLAVCVCSLTFGDLAIQAQSGTPPSAGAASALELTNARVVLLAKAGYSERDIIKIISQKPSQFDVTITGLARLAEQGLSERIVRAMVTNQRNQEQTAILPAFISDESIDRGNRPHDDALDRTLSQRPRLQSANRRRSWRALNPVSRVLRKSK